MTKPTTKRPNGASKKGDDLRDLTPTLTNIKDLSPYPNNARVHSKEQIGLIADSIKEFGWTVPIIVDANNTIIAGHGRLAAAKKLGMDTVPTIQITDLTPEQQRAYTIADNQLTEMATWDKEILGGELAELDIEQFDLSLTGFNDRELDNIIAGNGAFDDSWKDQNTEGDEQSENNGELSKWGYSLRARKHLKEACEACGHDEELLVHHVNHDRSMNEDESLQTLCKRCHDFWHVMNRLIKRHPSGRMPQLIK